MVVWGEQKLALEEWTQALENADGTCEICAYWLDHLVNVLSETSPLTEYTHDYFDFDNTLDELRVYCYCVEQACGELVDCSPLRQLLDTAGQCDTMRAHERQISRVSIPSYGVIAELLSITDAVISILLHTNAGLETELGKASYFKTFAKRGGREKIAALLSGVSLQDICSD